MVTVCRDVLTTMASTASESKDAKSQQGHGYICNSDVEGYERVLINKVSLYGAYIIL